MPSLRSRVAKLALENPEMRADLARTLRAADESDAEGKFEKGKPADPTKNMSPADKKKWEEENEKHRDQFKAARDTYEGLDAGYDVRKATRLFDAFSEKILDGVDEGTADILTRTNREFIGVIAIGEPRNASHAVWLTVEPWMNGVRYSVAVRAFEPGTRGRIRRWEDGGKSYTADSVLGFRADQAIKDINADLKQSQRLAADKSASLDARTLDQLVEMEAESSELANWRDAHATPAVTREAAKFERAVSKALSVWAQEHPPEDGSTVEDLMAEEATYNVFMTLEGHGVGIWDGRWGRFYRDTTRLSRFLERALAKEHQNLKDALMDAAFETGE